MIYGYLRVSSDEQDVNSQRQGVENFAAAKGWTIDEIVADEGVSGGKDPSKRALGPLLERLKEGDVVIASEISRLGRDLFMVMEILHLCMKKKCVICTVKDRYTLGDDVQSKVLAFAFGLAAEIERQLIRQRTREGLRLRMKLGVLLGRPPGRRSSERSCDPHKDEILRALEWGAPANRIAEKIGVHRLTLYAALVDWGVKPKTADFARFLEKQKRRRAAERRCAYKDTPYCIVPLPRERVRELILRDMTLPQIAEELPTFTYEQIYDSVSADEEFSALYRAHGMLKVKKKHY